MSDEALSAHEQMLLLSIAAKHKREGKSQRASIVENAAFISDKNTTEENARRVKHARLIISVN